MKIKINKLNKVIYLEKFNFTNDEALTWCIAQITANNLNDYNLLILERGESPASCFQMYDRFKALLIQHEYRNNVYVLTETEISAYHTFIKNRYGWECVFLSAFYDYPMMYERTYDLKFDASVHIHHWQLDYKIPSEKNIEKHFLTLNRSYRNNAHWHRMELYKFLKEFDLLKNSYASFRFIKEFDNNFNEPINHIDDINTNHRLYTQIDLKPLYQKSFISLLTESNFDSNINLTLLSVDRNSSNITYQFKNDYLTEKTSRTISLGMPFIMIGPAYSLNRLKNMGFKTFSNFIDESYDDCMDDDKRFKLIQSEIIKISKLTINEMESIYKEIYPILLHNRNNIKNIQDNNAKKVKSLWK